VGDRHQDALLKVPSSTSIGLWFGMYATVCAMASMDAHDMATIWSKSMRRAHINTEDDQLLPTFAPPLRAREETPTTSNEEVSNEAQVYGAMCIADESIPICSRTLWSDAIDRWAESESTLSEGNQSTVPIRWPDQKESIVIQKLQLLQFCIAMLHESPIYEFPEESVTLVVPADDHEQEKVVSAENIGIAESAGETADVHPASPRTIVVRQPALFRRLPLTEDSIAMNKYLSKKVNISTSRSNRAHPTLKVQLQFPSIMSDMKAFKAANPDLLLRDFCLWYGFLPVEGAGASAESASSGPATRVPTPAPAAENAANSRSKAARAPAFIPMPLDELQKVWASCDPVPCQDQGKPLFQCEKESEKALAYLESVSAVQLGTEMLCSGMRMLFGIVSAQLEPWLADTAAPAVADTTGESASGKLNAGDPSDGEQTPASGKNSVSASLAMLKAALRSDLAVLIEQVELAVDHLTIAKTGDVAAAAAPQSPTGSSHVEVSVAASILIDSVAGLLQKLEGMLVKMQTFESLLLSSKGLGADSLIHTLARRDTCTAESDAEMSILYELTKSLRNFRENIHDWHSQDGKELGQPTKKTFTCKLEQPRTVKHEPSTPASAGAVETMNDAQAHATTSSGSQKSATTSERAGNSNTSSGAGGGNGALPAGTVLNSASTLLDIFHLEAAVEKDSLRLSYRVPES
jgi:hypothetical protein